MPITQILFCLCTIIILFITTGCTSDVKPADRPLASSVIEGIGDRIDVERAIIRLDSMLDERPAIMRGKRSRIDSLMLALAQSQDGYDRIKNLEGLYQEYRSFSMDTTLHIARRYVNECEALGNDSLVNEGRLMIAEGLKGLGHYTDALNVLSKIPEGWCAKRRNSVLNRYISVYYSLADYASTADEAEVYRRQCDAYRDTLMAMLRSTDDAYWLNMAEKNRNTGNPAKALENLTSLLACKPVTVEKGVIAYSIARTYEALDRIEEAKFYYAVAATYDIKNSVRKYEALQELARILAEQGDHERAYTYIVTAIDDITASNARSRIQRIAGYVPIVTGAYHDAEKRESLAMIWLVVALGALLIVFAVSIVFVRRHNSRLSEERQELARKNAELEALQRELSQVNHNLMQSSKIKEQYLGYLFNLCSEYIMSLDKYRAQLAQRIKSGKVRDLNAMLAPSAVSEHLQNFYGEFDSIFLDIYPDFITKINELFEDGYRLEPRQGEKLSPELRIYALVRLGITESIQIATFLNYSTQTVYNYRSRVRQHARPGLGSFAQAVRNL